MTLVRRIHRVLALLYLLALATQVYLAGLGLFGASTFVPHAVLGFCMILGAILILVLAFAAREKARARWLAGLIVLLTIVQPVLISLRGRMPQIAALHPVIALALFATVAAILRSRNQQAE